MNVCTVIVLVIKVKIKILLWINIISEITVLILITSQNEYKGSTLNIY